MKIQLIYQKENSEGKYELLHEESLPRTDYGWQLLTDLFPPPPDFSTGNFEFWFLPEKSDELQEVALKGCSGRENRLIEAQVMIGDLEYAAGIVSQKTKFLNKTVLDVRITDVNRMI